MDEKDLYQDLYYIGPPEGNLYLSGGLEAIADTYFEGTRDILATLVDRGG